VAKKSSSAHVEHPSVPLDATVFTIQLPEQELPGFSGAGKEAKAQTLEAVNESLAANGLDTLKRWPAGLSEAIDDAFAWAKARIDSELFGEGPFHIVVTGVLPDPRFNMTLSVGVSSMAPKETPLPENAMQGGSV
jgi:hypothetical protein